jgi:lipoprotein-anchoring transpeptidase ErfK/SrfK
MSFTTMRALGALFLVAALAACGAKTGASRGEVPGYGALHDGDYTLPAVDPQYLVEPNRRALVPYMHPDAPGTIVVDPFAKFLFWVNGDGTATRYPIAVGREGLGFRGSATVRRKEIWPGWQPTANMLRREPEVYGPYRDGVEGGLRSPLGARALYLYRGGRDTYYRIHGTNDLGSIGHNSSAGCIRLFNQDIIDLFLKTDTSTDVRVRTLEESIRYEGEAMAHRGDDMAPTITSIDGSTPPIDERGLPILEPRVGGG